MILYKKIILEKGEIEIFEPWSTYLYSTLFSFEVEHKLQQLEPNSLLVPIHLEKTFIEVIEKSLQKLLALGYSAPTHRALSRHGSRYMIITMNDHKYWVNYRTELFGIISYGIFSVIQHLRNLSQMESKDTNG